MTQRHVFIFALGPVQTFIAAARRTRDLWYGSELLSRLAEVAASTLQTSYAAELIFPAHSSLGQKHGVSNKVVGVVQSVDMAALAQTVKRAVQCALEDEGQRCLEHLKQRGLGSVNDDGRFMLQLAQAIDVYAAWAPWPETGCSYHMAYTRAQHALDARKRLRDFAPNATAQVGARLSSLDGAQESLVTVAKPADRRRWRAFGVDEHEGLDAVGLIKRVLGTEQGFAAVTRVALQPWVETWDDTAVADLTKPMEALRQLGLAGRNRCVTPDPMARFPYDGELLIASRRASLEAKLRGELLNPNTVDDARPEWDALAALNKQLHAPPSPAAATPAGAVDARQRYPLPEGGALYVAMLLADGDQMGALLSSEYCSDETHKQLSEGLAAFAQAAGPMVQQHGGSCIYAGGDDVIALLPVASALVCARELADHFHTLLQPLAPADAGLQATLSVGVAFAHVLTPLGEMRALAAAALQLAKLGPKRQGLRNALAVLVQPRNGAGVQVAGRWNEQKPGADGPGLDSALNCWRTAFDDGQLSQSAPYDLMLLHREVPAVALPYEAKRLVRRRSRDGSSLPAGVQEILKPGLRYTMAERLHMLADEWYVARWLAKQPKAPPDIRDDTATNTGPHNALIAQDAI